VDDGSVNGGLGVMKKNAQRYAVLTGDVVDSSKLAPPYLQNVMRRIREGSKRFSETFPDTIYGELSVFSGDGWQLLMTDWKRSLRATLFLRTVVKSDEERLLDTRIAVAWGPVNEDSLAPTSISESTGEAFTRSGRALRGLRKRSRLAVSLPDEFTAAFTGLFTASIGVVDELISRATPKQAQTLSLALLGMTQDRIASETGKSQSTIHKALRTSGWQGIEEYLNEIEYRL
jgi:hypothetical protein